MTPQFSEIGPFKLTENCENENYELCSNWAGKNRKLRGLLGCLGRKLRGMSMIWNTENCENENYGAENCGYTNDNEIIMLNFETTVLPIFLPPKAYPYVACLLAHE